MYKIQLINNERSLELKFGCCYALKFSFFENSNLLHFYFISIQINFFLKIF